MAVVHSTDPLAKQPYGTFKSQMPKEDMLFLDNTNLTDKNDEKGKPDSSSLFHTNGDDLKCQGDIGVGPDRTKADLHGKE